jgi:hypothetical protein
MSRPRGSGGVTVRTGDIWRLAALAAGILACGGLALGARMAKRADPKGNQGMMPGGGWQTPLSDGLATAPRL